MKKAIAVALLLTLAGCGTAPQMTSVSRDASLAAQAKRAALQTKILSITPEDLSTVKPGSTVEFEVAYEVRNARWQGETRDKFGVQVLDQDGKQLNMGIRMSVPSDAWQATETFKVNIPEGTREVKVVLAIFRGDKTLTTKPGERTFKLPL